MEALCHWDREETSLLRETLDSGEGGSYLLQQRFRMDASGYMARHTPQVHAYCYDKRLVVLLADHCPAHKPPLGATPWQQGNLQGDKVSNVLLIYFEPN